MIENFVKAWDENKGRLKKYIEMHSQNDYNTYKKLVVALFDQVINPYYLSHGDCKSWAHGKHDKFDLSKLHEIECGSYQGTIIFVLPTPECAFDCEEGFVMTGVDYGSCSGCDTLQGIQAEGDITDRPTESQVRDYMILLLHLLQHCKYIDEQFYFDQEETESQYKE